MAGNLAIGAASPTPAPTASEASAFNIAVHEYLCSMITICDQKAAFVFAITAAVIAYLHECKLIKAALASFTFKNLVTDASVALLLLSAGLALFVVTPRLRGAASGLVYFNGIIRFRDARAYSTHLRSLQEQGLAEALAEHSYELSQVCHRKYRLLTYSMLSAAVGLGMALIAVTISS